MYDPRYEYRYGVALSAGSLGAMVTKAGNNASAQRYAAASQAVGRERTLARLRATPDRLS